MSVTPKPMKNRIPMRDEGWFFVGLAIFFIVVAVLYGLWSQFEPVGTVSLLLLFGMNGMAGFYVMKLSKEVDVRPEDVVLAEVEDYAGDYNRFSPWSWWPLVAGLAATFLFLGPALHQWWLMGFAGVIGAIGLIGWGLEFNRGHNAK